MCDDNDNLYILQSTSQLTDAVTVCNACSLSAPAANATWLAQKVNCSASMQDAGASKITIKRKISILNGVFNARVYCRYTPVPTVQQALLPTGLQHCC